MKWNTIDNLPVEYELTNKMFVVKAIDVVTASGMKYTSDPYCVWFSTHDSSYARWPHPFDPTHFVELP